jgi:dTMP kinase
LAYNCNNPEELAFVQQLNQHFPNPDLVIYIDVIPDISLARIKNRAITEVYEKQEKLMKVRQMFVEIFKEYEDNFLQLDGSDTIEQLHRNIINYLEQLI